MARVIILGATGSLGRDVLGQALAAGHEVTVVVRTPSKLAPEAQERVTLLTSDLSAGVELDALSGQDALINCAGRVTDGETFVQLIDRVVRSVDVLPVAEQPVCWFLAGVALLDVDAAGRRLVDLPMVNSTYWPHRANYERLIQSRLDWRLLCPGPMVDEPPVGVNRLRISLDVLPVASDALTDASLLQAAASLMPQMIVPYADAAAVMLANLDRGNAMSHHRVGLALPVGMQGQKSQWMARNDSQPT